MFRTILLAHIAMGIVGLVVGPVLMFGRKTAGLHTRLGGFYHWVMLGICASAAALALLDWEHLWWFLWIGVGSYAFALLGYISGKLRWRGWLIPHLIGQGGSYIAIITAVSVTNWSFLFGWTGLSSAWAWSLPTIVGTPIIVWVAREVALGKRPNVIRGPNVKGILKAMVWTKTKISIVVGVGVSFTAGAAIVTVREVAAHRPEAWQQKYDLTVLERLPPQARIVPAIPAIFFRPGGSWGNNAHGMMGLGAAARDVVQSAYNGTLGRMIFSAPLPGGSYDFISNFPQDADKALQHEVTNKFGLIARRERKEAKVLVLTVRNRNAAGLKRSSASAIETSSNRDRGSGSYSCNNLPLSNLVEFLEDYFETPVVDRTGITGNFDIQLKGDSTAEGVKRVLQQLGLELVPSRESIEFLIVDKMN